MYTGGVLTAPRGVTRGLSSPADWLTAAAAVSRSSSVTSTSLSRGGSRRGPQGLHVRRGSLDADVHVLLTHEEEEEYLSKSLKAAAHRYHLLSCAFSREESYVARSNFRAADVQQS